MRNYNGRFQVIFDTFQWLQMLEDATGSNNKKIVISLNDVLVINV